jgi:hypothetical protein
MSRDDRDQQIAELERALHRLRCEYRRVCDELDWRDEKIRVLSRVIERLSHEGTDDDDD